MLVDSLISGVSSVVGQLIDNIFPNPEDANKAKLEMMRLEQSGKLAELALDGTKAKALASIVRSEAKSESWLTRNYRPIIYLMLLVFASARVFGFASLNLSATENLQIWKLLEFGLTLGIGSRGLEKISYNLKDMLKK